MERKKTSILTYLVFAFALGIVLTSLALVMFPSLLISQIAGSETQAQPFATGPWFIPIVVTNLSILILGILYQRKILPMSIRKSFEFIFNFEVSRTVAIFVVVAILFAYIGFSMDELSEFEGDTWGDFLNIKEVVIDWPFNDGTQPTLELLHVKNFLLKSSLVIFENIRVIPFVATIAMILLVYFFTTKITKKRFAGIVAMVILIQSYNFNLFDSLATYSNFWILFFLLSLYLVDKKWVLSPISYIVSLFSKPLTFAYLPMMMFFVYRSELLRRKKIILIMPYAIILSLVFLIIFVPEFSKFTPFGSAKIDFDEIGFLSGFTLWAFQLRFEGIFLMFILPITVGLFLIARKGMKRADSILFLITGIAFAMPLLAGFTEWNLHPYRFIPLLVFFAIGVGTLFYKRNIIPEADTQYK